MSHHIAMVMAAMDEEIRCTASLMHKNILRATCVRSIGVGKIQAALTTQEILTNHARMPSHPVSVLNECQTLSRDKLNFILVGSAGGIGVGLEPGDVVISTDTMFHDVDAAPLGFAKGEIPFTKQSIWKADTRLIEMAQRACQKLGITPKLGRMLTGDRFITDPIEAKNLAVEHDGLTVDWETAAVAFVAARARVPWVSIRVVSDLADSKATAEFNNNLPPVARVLADIIKKIDILFQEENGPKRAFLL